jgi:multidrug transporter EmrE-like cation transporter
MKGADLHSINPITVAIFLIIAISLGVFGQIALKHGMTQYKVQHPDADNTGLIAGLLRAIFTPYVLLGLGCYVISTGFWLIVISKWQLSYAYPMIAVGYIGVVFLSQLFFGEHVTPLQWVGIVLMIGGLVLVVTFGSSTGAKKMSDAHAPTSHVVAVERPPHPN